MTRTTPRFWLGPLLAAALTAVASAAWHVPTAAATILPAGFDEFQVASGFKDPTTVAVAPDGRIFVAEQGGTIRIVEHGALLPTPFLTLTDVDEHGERGLESMTFDPDFASNHYVYVFYSAATPVVHNRVSRFTANGDLADPLSEADLLDVEPATSTYHNGGALQFGADGMLYVTTGDNLDPPNAQDLTNLKGKLLRIRRNGTIPRSNPFYSRTTGAARAVWALGLRNPYTLAVQPGTGRMFVNDVGLHTWEEIDDAVVGGNYGWPVYEGVSHDPSYNDPVYVYLHGDGLEKGCAIIGGAFYDPKLIGFPAVYLNRYFFADYCNGWISAFDPASGTVSGFASGAVRITGLTLDPRTGDLYYLSRPVFHGVGGSLYRITYTGSEAPRVDVPPQSMEASVGQPASFTILPTGEPPFGYQWRRNGVSIPGAQSDTYALPAAALADDGAKFDVIVSNAFGSVRSGAATLTVTDRQPPLVVITRPTATRMYQAGQTVDFVGTATDSDGTVLPARDFTWTVTFHHRDHEHPFMPPTAGIKHGSFTVPSSDFETDWVVYFHIVLTVVDSHGLSTTATRDVQPRLGKIQLATSPPGLSVLLDGTTTPTPLAFPGVVGFQRTLGVVSPQTRNGIVYVFDAWSDGGAPTHTIVTAPADTTYTASFHAVPSPGGPPPPPVAPGAGAAERRRQ